MNCLFAFGLQESMVLNKTETCFSTDDKVANPLQEQSFSFQGEQKSVLNLRKRTLNPTVINVQNLKAFYWFSITAWHNYGTRKYLR